MQYNKNRTTSISGIIFRRIKLSDAEATIYTNLYLFLIITLNIKYKFTIILYFYVN